MTVEKQFFSVFPQHGTPKRRIQREYYEFRKGFFFFFSPSFLCPLIYYSSPTLNNLHFTPLVLKHGRRRFALSFSPPPPLGKGEKRREREPDKTIWSAPLPPFFPKPKLHFFAYASHPKKSFFLFSSLIAEKEKRSKTKMRSSRHFKNPA